MFGSKKFFKTATGAGTPTAVKATQGTPTTGNRFLITDIGGSSDKAGAILKLVEDTEGTPIILWEVQIGAGNYSHNFKTSIQVKVNKSVGVEVDGTDLCKANIAGEETGY